MIKAIQIKKIHALKNRLGWSDEQYRGYLMTEGEGFATSCKDLSEQEAERLIRQMELAAAAKGVWEMRGASSVERGASKKYDELGDRPGMATPKQLRMIEAMWAEVSYYRNAEARERALRYFLNHITGVDDLRFVEAWQVRKVVKALQKIKGRKYETKRCKALC
jgi:phage gp16-like protein